MTILRLTNKLRQYLAGSFPTKITTTIVSIQGTTMVVADNTGTTGAWAGGLIKVLSGDLTDETVAVANNVGTTLHIGTPFDSEDTAELVGATIELSGGPLADAAVFHIQPESIRDLVNSGTKDFVFIYPLEYSISGRGVARGGASKSAQNQNRAYQLQIMCQVPFATGGTTIADAYAKQTRIYNLAEQTITRCHSFRFEPRRPVFDADALEVSFGLLEREGVDPAEVAIITMGFALAL
jgi:hypothetical protein